MQPLAGRSIWLVGIGGAGMSAYALVARGWGASVGGWDRVETPYLHPLRSAGIEVVVSPEPEARAGWETFVSSAHPSVAGRPRGELLAELVSLAPAMVVAGAHGKGTTAAMIAYVLRETGRDPSWVVGADVPQLGGNGGAGDGWLVAEGDESDRSLELLRPEIGVLTNVDLDHHATFGSRAEVEELFERWLAGCPQQVRGDRLEPSALELALPGEHNRRNAATALAALELAGVDRAEAEAALEGFRGTGRRFEVVGQARGIRIYDDYAHHPAEIAATIAAAREAHPGARLLVLFQPHLFSRTRHLARELAAALAAADVVAVTDVYAAREEPIAGVTGKLVVDALASARPGIAPGWMPRLDDGARFLARRARHGDVVVTMGAGDVDRVARALLEELG